MPGNLIRLRFMLNEEEATLQCPAGMRLIDILHDHFGLMETREGCGAGECGSCLVLKDGQPVNACLVPAFSLADAEVVTVEGIQSLKSFAELRRNLPGSEELRCGFCASGFAVALAGQLMGGLEVGEGDIREALAGVLCSCGNYPAVVEETLRRISRKRKYGRKRD